MNAQRRAILQQAPALALLPWPLLARAQAAKPVRLRGTIEALTADHLRLRERSGELIELALAPRLSVTEVYPVTLADVHAGSFIGVGAMPQPDGSQRAIAVTVFPEAMRGTGEGHRPFDFLSQSTMTNATVADVVAAPDGRRLQVTYNGGKQIIVVPPEAPVVSLRPADRSLLAVGGNVALSAQLVDGRPTATRISAGRNGFAPPY